MTHNIPYSLASKLQSEEALQELGRSLEQAGLLGNFPVMGRKSGASSIKESLSSAIHDTPKEKFQDELIFENIRNTGVTVSQIYKDNKRKTFITFIFSLLCIGVSLGIIFWVILIENHSGESIKFIEAIAGAIPGLLGGTIFFFHKRQQRRLDRIEEDVHTFAKYENNLAIMVKLKKSIDDPNLAKAICEKIWLN